MTLVAAPEPLAAPVIDTHTHLNLHDRYLHGDYVPDADELLAIAAAVNVTKVVQIGCDVGYARHSIEMARSRHRPWWSASPCIPMTPPAIEEDGAAAALDAALAEIAALAEDDVVRAVGETGLDYYRTGDESRPAQHRAFRCHIDLATRLGKTLVIHDRDSHDDVLAILEDQGAPERVVFHCFSGDAAMAAYCAERGWFLSFAGPITYKANDGLRAALAVVPDDLVLVETDAPYLARCRTKASPTRRTSCRTPCGASPPSAAPTRRHVRTPLRQRRAGVRRVVTTDAPDDGLLGGGDVRALATQLGLRPTKRWGQNLVTDPNTVRRIVRAARLQGRRRPRGRSGLGQPDPRAPAARAPRGRRRDRRDARRTVAADRRRAPAGVRDRLDGSPRTPCGSTPCRPRRPRSSPTSPTTSPSLSCSTSSRSRRR